jgi:hypothetical protein
MLRMTTSKPRSTPANLPLQVYARCDPQHKIALSGEIDGGRSSADRGQRGEAAGVGAQDLTVLVR